MNNAIEIDPKDSIAYHLRGHAKVNLEDLQGSIDDWSKAIDINPQDSEAYRNRGASKELVNDLEGACQDWKKSADLGFKKLLNG